MPLVVVLALVIGSVTGDNNPSPAGRTDPSAVLTFAAPPGVDAQATPCVKVLAELPVTLGTLNQRVVHTTPDTPFVVAWGSPAVVLRCGVDRPKDLREGSSAQFVLAGPVNGPSYDVTTEGSSNVFTTVDRAAYVSVTIPKQYQGGNVMPPISEAIAKALPQVCDPDGAAPIATRCTRRA